MISKTGKLIFLLLSVCSMLLSAEQNTNELHARRELPQSVPYCDDDTGVVFPAEIGVFYKTQVRKNTNAIYGTCIRYSARIPGAMADVYIYSLKMESDDISVPEFTEHFERIRKDILERRDTRISRMESLGESRFHLHKTLAALQENYSFYLNGDSCYSRMIMILSGDKVIKLRITVPAESPGAIVQTNLFSRTICKLYLNAKSITFTPYKRSGDDSGEKEE